MKVSGVIFATLLVTASGCRTVYTWNGGFPRPAAALPAASRQAEMARFTITDIDHETVEIDGFYYSRESFAPIFRHASPEVLPTLAHADDFVGEGVLFSTAVVSLTSYALTAHLSPSLELARKTAIFGSALGGGYVSYQARQAFNQAKVIYMKALERRIMGTNEKQ